MCLCHTKRDTEYNVFRALHQIQPGKRSKLLSHHGREREVLVELWGCEGWTSVIRYPDPQGNSQTGRRCLSDCYPGDHSVLRAWFFMRVLSEPNPLFTVLERWLGSVRIQELHFLTSSTVFARSYSNGLDRWNERSDFCYFSPNCDSVYFTYLCLTTPNIATPGSTHWQVRAAERWSYLLSDRWVTPQRWEFSSLWRHSAI